ncbi:hypothetical protein [Demequina sp. NBRC 110053]|uniref:hypothetical protein n=1 Tax=Demequina sp. NBRC 110053 TaxID=1570342 RepID=UPI0009FDA682|nr:hypothetical protein [Demequina sp. NBRC 110053]
MRDVAHELAAQIAADARALSHVQAPSTVQREIRRRRRRSALGWGAGSALGVGALAVAAVTTAGSLAEPEEAAPTPSASSTAPIAYATVDLDDAVPYGGWGGLEWLGCGDPAPEPVSRSGGFSAAFEFDIDSELSQDAYGATEVSLGSVAITGSPEVPTGAMVSAPLMIFVQDGVVVGFDGGGGSAGWMEISPDWSLDASGTWWNYAFSCDASAGFLPLEAGDYDVYLVAHIAASPQLAALQDLSNQGLTIADAPHWEHLLPGSYECQQYADWQMHEPLLCDPDAHPGTTVDRDAGTITVPYHASLHGADLDVTLVSEPRAVTLGEPSNALGSAGSPEPLADGEVPQCDEVYGWAYSPGLALHWPGDLASLAPGDVIEPAAWPVEGDWSEVTVDLPSEGRIWLFEEAVIDVDEHTSVHAERAVGWADVTATVATTLTVVRYDGPQPWSVRVEDVQWCGERATSVFSAIMVEPLTITDDAGTREVTGPIVVSPQR